MGIGQYFRRVLSYLLKMAIVVGLIFLVMVLTKTTTISGSQLFITLFSSTRGLILIILLLALALANPFLGYVSRAVTVNPDRQREIIVNAMATCAYNLVWEEPGKMVFRANSPIKKAMHLWGEAITVTIDGRNIILSGARKEVVKAVYRINTLNY